MSHQEIKKQRGLITKSFLILIGSVFAVSFGYLTVLFFLELAPTFLIVSSIFEFIIYNLGFLLYFLYLSFIIRLKALASLVYFGLILANVLLFTGFNYLFILGFLLVPSLLVVHFAHKEIPGSQNPLFFEAIHTLQYAVIFGSIFLTFFNPIFILPSLFTIASGSLTWSKKALGGCPVTILQARYTSDKKRKEELLSVGYIRFYAEHWFGLTLSFRQRVVLSSIFILYVLIAWVRWNLLY